jgi:hypothetical protein
MNDTEEKEKLQQAIYNPKSKLAVEMLKKYKPYFSFCGKDINYGAMEANKVKSFILETQKRMQAPFCFLTLNMEEVHNPRSIRACARTVDNRHFPAVFEEGCPYGENGTQFMEYLKTVGKVVGEGQIDFSEAGRAKMAMDDPITFVEETKQMLNDVCSLLLGIPPEEFYAALDSESRRKTKYFKCNKGVFGHSLAYIGVTEDHKKVSCCFCHFHVHFGNSYITHLPYLSHTGHFALPFAHLWRYFCICHATICCNAGHLRRNIKGTRLHVPFGTSNKIPPSRTGTQACGGTRYAIYTAISIKRSSTQ